MEELLEAKFVAAWNTAGPGVAWSTMVWDALIFIVADS